ncbi:MAG: RNA polymerase sigma factor [Planctomycetota bacterium]
MATPTDERLFIRYREGDSEALRNLLDRHHDDLMRFLFRMTGDRQLAEDAFQDAFLQIHQSAGTFDANRSFRPWLFTVAANKARDLLRKKGRRHMVPLSAPVGGGGERDGRQSSFIDLIEVNTEGPGDRLGDTERDSLVQQAVDDLSPTLREILLLAYFQRLSYAQIADDLDIPLGTVKSRLHAAVAGFAKSWRQRLAASEARLEGEQ